VLAAIELDGHAAADARGAADVARWFKARLQLVTVVSPAQTPSWFPIRGGARDLGLALAARTRLQALAAKLRHRAVSVRVLMGDPAEQISAASADSGAAIIVLRLRPSGRLLGARQGTVTYRVLCNATVPVLALAEAAKRS
jgi:nucleotide-binding universal stress UspA family protein